MEDLKIPRHIAVIPDGNGRWAKKRFMPRNYGHVQGARAVEKMCEDVYNMGVEYLTVYAFSTENWRRPTEEVDAIMKLLRNYLKDCLKRSEKNNMKVSVLGDKEMLSPDIKASIEELEQKSASNTGLKFQVALNYGGRDELLRAFKKMSEDLANNQFTVNEIDEKVISSYLDTKGIPDPDLLIRTSGEQRISNYLLWQLAYTEFYFADVLWPDFDNKELEKAIAYYNRRERRFGGV
ncbi:isoprenyl transferase [Anaeromicropila populeti]|uniref:Isoprenyl transferase n=1 Tax=Anaeromicropila populeti TaxID=37658 RepID=A0A1I6KJS8_9FIRM|nr:isoprenyl transferase [Anaeromicropila populeti]SFR91414.1 undecaprenyl diphosphate synthase [Anaeromicropila populeti]